MSEAVSDRPTFTQAFSASESATGSLPVTPSTETPETVSASAATTEPPVPAATPEVTPAEGPIPYPRFKEVNEAKNKFEADLTALKTKLGWAEQVDREAVLEAQRLGQLYQKDRPTYIRQVLAEALTDADLAPLVRSEAARVLAGARQSQQPPTFEPDIPVYDDKGQLVNQTFSAQKQRELIAHLVSEALGKEVGPLKQTVQSVQQERETLARQKDADTKATALYEQASAWDGFKEHEQEIAKAFSEHPEWSLQDAYIAVVPAKLRAAESAKTLDKLKTQAAASTVNPAAAVVASTKRPTSFNDPSLKW